MMREGSVDDDESQRPKRRKRESKGPTFHNIVTPTPRHVASSTENDKVESVRRALFTKGQPSGVVTPQKPESPAKKRLMFGRYVDAIHIQPNVREVYKIVRKLTGSIGGNGCSGPIYGELTMGSMQKVVNLMKEHLHLNETSKFIDVGSGIGKPNLHVCQDPGVELSYGIEVEDARWVLGMTCLRGVLDAASQQEGSAVEPDSAIQHRCYFQKGDIREAQNFNPFTHIYMFSIGFPPTLWIELAAMWNRSRSENLICYHGPRDIIHNYEFDVVLIAQAPTSMHGSKEGHSVYLYKRKGIGKSKQDDKLFAPLQKLVNSGLSALRNTVANDLETATGDVGPRTRSKRSRR